MFTRLIDRFRAPARALRRLRPALAAAGALEATLTLVPDAALRDTAQTVRDRFQHRVAADREIAPAEVLPQILALGREAGQRTLGLRAYDEQLAGAIILLEGRIAEMATGEGKTLSAALAAVAHALLAGTGTHILTVNPYLARRDVQWMGPLYALLGLQVGLLQQGESYRYDLADPGARLIPCSRKEAYQADVTYGTVNDFALDYLSDTARLHPGTTVQRPAAYAIVDEADNVLIDLARTPLSISGPAGPPSAEYPRLARIVPRLVCAGRVADDVKALASVPGDYIVREKSRDITITEQGTATLEAALGVENLYDVAHTRLLYHCQVAVMAEALYTRDVHYVVQDQRVVMIDEHTGRLAPTRRWLGGLHQALEAKEGVPIQPESQNYGRITIQHYCRRYPKLAGMTGTARTQAAEFGAIYGLRVVPIPPHRPCIRHDAQDQVFATEAEKVAAVVARVAAAHAQGRPVLIGTASIEKSQAMSIQLTLQGIPHDVLNGQPAHADQEAAIIAQAGRRGAVTVATNMAGRGVDILLGGDPLRRALQYGDTPVMPPTDPAAVAAAAREVATLSARGLLPVADPAAFVPTLAHCREVAAQERAAILAVGGLLILGTERHEARRIDDQFRGRAGRQGDPGESVFLLSLDDELFRRMGQQAKMKRLLQALKIPRGEMLQHRLLSRTIERCQQEIEATHLTSRKQLFEFDTVLQQQHRAVLAARQRLLDEPSAEPLVRELIAQQEARLIAAHADPEIYSENWDLEGLEAAFVATFKRPLTWAPEDRLALTYALLEDEVAAAGAAAYADLEARFTAPILRDAERMILLTILDQHWRTHLVDLEMLMEGIRWRLYGGKNVTREYQREAAILFDLMEADVSEEAVRRLLHAELRQADPTLAAA